MIKIKEIGSPLFYYSGSGRDGILVNILCEYNFLPMSFGLGFGSDNYPFYNQCSFKLFKDRFIQEYSLTIFNKYEDDIKQQLSEIMRKYVI